MARLTKTVVDGAEPREKRFTLWCSDLKGFGAYIHPTGLKVYFVDYYNADGARKRMTIGRHGRITCEQARTKAQSILGGVDLKGDDPLTERQTRRGSLTVADLCFDYMAAAERGLIIGKGGKPKKASTLATDRGRIERHIVPLLGSKLVRDLTRADVAKFVRDVAAGKTAMVEKTAKERGKAIVEGGQGAAARTFGFLGGILSFAVSEGVIEHNPARGVKRPADNKRTRRLTPDEFRALGDALKSAEEAQETWQGLAGVRLLALTGCRRGEIAKLRWCEVDIPGCALRLADSKEGASTRPLGRAARDVLGALDREEGGYVLPAVRGRGSYGGLDAFVEKMVARAGLEGVTAHTLRHSFASVAGDLGFTESTIAAMLGHSSGSVTSKYVHHLDAVLIAAADRVAGAIHRDMTGEAGDVVAFPGSGRRTEDA